MNSDEKICPRCAETIKAAAVVCRYCNHEFAEDVTKLPERQSGPDVDACPKCGKIYSTKFNECPHCKTSIGKGCLGTIVVIVGLILIVSLFTSNDDSSSTAANDTCKSNWEKCADNAELVENYSRWMDIKFACKTEANARAKYGNPEWPWAAFGRYLKGNDYITSGVAVAIETDVQLQNGFGAMVHSTATCKYDLRTRTVTDLEIVGH